jgi:hypothetical protein
MTNEIHRCYRMLELEPGASLEQVKQAWRELVKVWHPDRFPNDDKLQRNLRSPACKFASLSGAFCRRSGWLPNHVGMDDRRAIRLAKNKFCRIIKP